MDSPAGMEMSSLSKSNTLLTTHPSLLTTHAPTLTTHASTLPAFLPHRSQHLAQPVDGGQGCAHGVFHVGPKLLGKFLAHDVVPGQLGVFPMLIDRLPRRIELVTADV